MPFDDLLNQIQYRSKYSSAVKGCVNDIKAYLDRIIQNAEYITHAQYCDLRDLSQAVGNLSTAVINQAEDRKKRFRKCIR